MATDVTAGDAETAMAVREPAPLKAAAPPVGREHRRRFLFIYGLLAAVLGAAVAGVVVYAGQTIRPGPAWSAWKPHGGGLGAAKEIASQVSKSYRLPNGDQLVDVIAGAPLAPVVSGSTTVKIPIDYVALHGTSTTSDTLIPVSSSNSVVYSLCGLGTSCSIAPGKPTVQRGTLVRREILELALYTFKYASGIKNVIAFMPPVAGKPTYVVYLQKTDLDAELRAPLVQTLAAKTPLPSTIPARETQTVQTTTSSRTFSVVRISPTPQGDAVLELAPLTA
jgi:hypothetical protein